MKLSKILSTSVALGALSFASLSFAVPFTLTIDTSDTAGIDYTLTGDSSTTPVLNHVTAFTQNPLSGWNINVSTAIAGAAPSILSLDADVTKESASAATLTVIALLEGLTFSGTLSSLNNTIGAGESTVVDIDYGMGWVNLSSSVNISGNSEAENFFNIGNGSAQGYDLRITQTFVGNGEASTVINVSEPSIIALLALGLAGMGVASRRKHKVA